MLETTTLLCDKWVGDLAEERTSNSFFRVIVAGDPTTCSSETGHGTGERSVVPGANSVCREGGRLIDFVCVVR